MASLLSFRLLASWRARLSIRRRMTAYLFVVFKPDLLTDLDDFKRELSELVARIKATPRAEGVAEIRIPGERAFRSRERLRS